MGRNINWGGIMTGIPEGTGFFHSLKKIYWEWSAPNGRFEYTQFFFRQVPALLGQVLRRRFYRKYFEHCGKNVTIYPGVRIYNGYRMSIGDDVYLGLENSFQAGGGLVIKDRTALGPGCKIWTVNHRFDDLKTPIMEQGYDYKPVVIGPDVWLAANVFVMPGVEIPEGCVVAAGSVVGVKKYPPYSIIAGNPARVIGSRKKPGVESQSDVNEVVVPVTSTAFPEA